MRVAFEGFCQSLDESHPGRQEQACVDEIGTLAVELSKERHDKVYNNFLLNTLFISRIPMAPFQHSGCPI